MGLQAFVNIIPVRPVFVEKIFKIPLILQHQIGKASGLAGIAYWINKHFGLPEGQSVTKQSPIVVKVKEEIDRLYADGRTTVMGDDELMQIINFYYPRMNAEEV